jgi:hypothetical protein
MREKPSRHTNHTEYEIYVMEEALRSMGNLVRDTDCDVVTEDTLTELENRVEERKQSFQSDRMNVAVDDYIANHTEKVNKIFETESLDTEVSLLKDAREAIMGRFDYYEPETPTLDEMKELLLEGYKDSSWTDGLPPGVDSEEV